MDISILLAKIFGVYMLVIGLSFLKRPHLRGILNNMSKDPDTRFILSLFILAAGILLVVNHNIWTGGYKVIITLVSWIILIKGATGVYLSEESYRKMVEYLNTPNMLTAFGALNLVLGVYFTYIGFFI
jgi:hypothetical protein